MTIDGHCPAWFTALCITAITCTCAWAATSILKGPRK
jgi:hypothetical protein